MNKLQQFLSDSKNIMTFPHTKLSKISQNITKPRIFVMSIKGIAKKTKMSKIKAWPFLRNFLSEQAGLYRVVSTHLYAPFAVWAGRPSLSPAQKERT